YMDGLYLLEKIKESHNDLSFIIFTGKGREEVAIQALNLGADYYLQKGGDPKSQFRELVNLIEKIAEKKNAEIALRKSEEKFSKAFKYSLNSIGIYKIQDKQFIDVNENFSKMVDYERSEITGRTLDELHLFVNPKDYENLEKILLSKNEIFDFETLLLGKNARIIPVQISATLIDIEGELSVLLLIRDFSEIAQALEALKENELKYRLLFDESPIALFQISLLDAKIWLDNLGKNGLEEFLEKLKRNPREIEVLIPMIKIVEMNKTAMNSFSSDTTIKNVHVKYPLLYKNIDFISSLLKELLTGSSFIEKEYTIYNLHDRELRIIIRLSIAPNSEKSWSKILVSIIDITEWTQALKTIQNERKLFKMIANSAIETNEESKLCELILYDLIEVLHYEFGSLRLYNAKEEMFYPIATYGLENADNETMKPISIKDSSNVLASRLKNKEIIIVSDVKSNVLTKDSELFKKLGIQTYIFCPLLDNEKNYLGSLQLGSKYRKNVSQEDIAFFETVSNIIVSIIKKSSKL
ncbi:MAG: PAS domain S-box protein, partial [Candidatus Thorarchaeota archaeon]